MSDDGSDDGRDTPGGHVDVRARHKEAEARRAERVRWAFQDLATAMDECGRRDKRAKANSQLNVLLSAAAMLRALHRQLASLSAAGAFPPHRDHHGAAGGASGNGSGGGGGGGRDTHGANGGGANGGPGSRGARGPASFGTECGGGGGAVGAYGLVSVTPLPQLSTTPPPPPPTGRPSTVGRRIPARVPQGTPGYASAHASGGSTGARTPECSLSVCTTGDEGVAAAEWRLASLPGPTDTPFGAHMGLEVWGGHSTPSPAVVVADVEYDRPMLVCNSAGAMVDCNDTFGQLTGYNREDLPHLPLSSLCLTPSHMDLVSTANAAAQSRKRRMVGTDALTSLVEAALGAVVQQVVHQAVLTLLARNGSQLEVCATASRALDGTHVFVRFDGVPAGHSAALAAASFMAPEVLAMPTATAPVPVPPSNAPTGMPGSSHTTTATAATMVTTTAAAAAGAGYAAQPAPRQDTPFDAPLSSAALPFGAAPGLVVSDGVAAAQGRKHSRQQCGDRGSDARGDHSWLSTGLDNMRLGMPPGAGLHHLLPVPVAASLGTGVVVSSGAFTSTPCGPQAATCPISSSSNGFGGRFAAVGYGHGGSTPRSTGRGGGMTPGGGADGAAPFSLPELALMGGEGLLDHPAFWASPSPL